MSQINPVRSARGLAKRCRRGVWALAKIDLAIATFAEADGSRISLVRGSADRSATLEEVVFGYLAASRVPTVAA